MPGSGEHAAATRRTPGENQLTIGSLPDSYNQNPSRPDLGKYPLNASIFDTLVRLDENLVVQPMLAERWEFDGQTNSYRFILRRGVTFHDGRQLRAEDVKHTFDFMIRAMPYNHQQLGADSVRVLDSHTVEISPVQPNRWLPEQLVHPVWGINRQGTDPNAAVGTGPFQLVEYRKNDRLVVKRSPSYWDSGSPARAAEVTFRFFSTSDERICALQSGEIDLMLDVPAARAYELEQDETLRVVESAVGAYNALSFNIASVPPYDLGGDCRVREAVGLAINRTAILEEVWHGRAQESATWIPPSVLGQHASLVKGPSYDPVRAAALLDEAGWTIGRDGIRVKGGRRLSLVHVLGGPGDSDPKDSVEAARWLQVQLRAVGVETWIEVPDTSPLPQGRYDIYQGVANQNEAYPGRLPDIIYFSKGAAGNRFRAPGGKTDEAIERCRSAATMDEAQRYAAEAAHQLVDVEHVIIPLVNLYRIWAMKETLRGFVPHPSLTNQRWERVYRVR